MLWKRPKKNPLSTRTVLCWALNICGRRAQRPAGRLNKIDRIHLWKILNRRLAQRIQWVKCLRERRRCGRVVEKTHIVCHTFLSCPLWTTHLYAGAPDATLWIARGGPKKCRWTPRYNNMNRPSALRWPCYYCYVKNHDSCNGLWVYPIPPLL